MIRTTVLALLLVVAVAACGDSDDGTDTATTTAPTTLPADDGDDDSSSDDQTRPAGGSDVYAIADLTVEVTHPDEDTITYRLSCLADTATVDDASAGVSAEAACQQLTDPEAVALLVDGPDASRTCAQVFGGPDEARVTGTLADDEVDVVLDRSDGCAIDDWDRLFGDVLPAPAADR